MPEGVTIERTHGGASVIRLAFDGDAERVTMTATAPDAGTVTVDGRTIEYVGLEPVLVPVRHGFHALLQDALGGQLLRLGVPVHVLLAFRGGAHERGAADAGGAARGGADGADGRGDGEHGQRERAL